MRVSIIIPIYKRVDLLDQCINSCKASTHPIFEFIIVDDGNSLEDKNKIAAIAAAHGATFISLEKNSGACVARNTGIDAASGDAYFFADADIILEKDAIEKMVEALEANPDAWYAFGDTNFGKRLLPAREYSAEELRKNNYIATMSLIRADKNARFDESLKRFQDWDFWLTIASRGGYGVYTHSLICTVTPNGTMSKWIPSFLIKNYRYFLWVPRVRAYIRAREVIIKKHGLTIA